MRYQTNQERLEQLRERMQSSAPLRDYVQQEILKELQAIRKLLEEKFNA